MIQIPNRRRLRVQLSASACIMNIVQHTSFNVVPHAIYFVQTEPSKTASSYYRTSLVTLSFTTSGRGGSLVLVTHIIAIVSFATKSNNKVLMMIIDKAAVWTSALFIIIFQYKINNIIISTNPSSLFHHVNMPLYVFMCMYIFCQAIPLINYSYTTVWSQNRYLW